MMKRSHLFLLLPLAACLTAMTGCTSGDAPGAVASGPVYHGYYGRGYYNETPPGTYNGPRADAGPFYGGGSVAVVNTEVEHDHIRREREDYSRNGRRYYQTSRQEYRPARNAAREHSRPVTERKKPQSGSSTRSGRHQRGETGHGAHRKPDTHHTNEAKKPQ